MNLHAKLEIIGVALACAAVVGFLGIIASWLLRNRSLRWQLLVIGVVAVAAPYTGLIAVTQKMFLSQHDLGVAMYVGSVSALVSLAAVIVLGWLVTRRSRQIRDQVRTLPNLPSAEATAPLRGPREFRELAAELDTVKRELVTARDRERQLEQSRRELISWMSHDLRTPLAGLRAMAEAIEDGLAPDPGRYLRRIRGDVDRMTSMVDNLLELSRIHAGDLPQRRDALELRDLISETIAGAEPVARSHDVTLGGNADDGLMLSADPNALSRVFSNLVMNAIRHTPAGGQVHINATASDGYVEVAISDGCAGIPAEDLPRVFDLGWQGSSARTPGEPSTGRAGLGLAIVRGLVEAHGGKVRVVNLAPAPGCCFLVNLPIL